MAWSHPSFSSKISKLSPSHAHLCCISWTSLKRYLLNVAESMSCKKSNPLRTRSVHWVRSTLLNDLPGSFLIIMKTWSLFSDVYVASAGAMFEIKKYPWIKMKHRVLLENSYLNIPRNMYHGTLAGTSNVSIKNFNYQFWFVILYIIFLYWLGSYRKLVFQSNDVVDDESCWTLCVREKMNQLATTE